MEEQLQLNKPPDIQQISDNQIHQEYIKRFTIPHGEIFNNSNDVVKHFRGYFTDSKRECLAVMYLNGRNAHLETCVLFKGSITSSAVYQREIIRKAINIGAVALIICHNHPSGNPNPSPEDKQITDKIILACKLMDMTLHDHIILAGNSFTSFADKGLI